MGIFCFSGSLPLCFCYSVCAICYVCLANKLSLSLSLSLLIIDKVIIDRTWCTTFLGHSVVFNVRYLCAVACSVQHLHVSVLIL